MSFVTLQAFGKALEVIDRLQISLRSFARILAPSFKNFPERLSMPAAFEISMFCNILKTSSWEVRLSWKSFSMIKTHFTVSYISLDFDFFLKLKTIPKIKKMS